MITSPNTKLTAVSIFTGAGGLDIGFERAGFSIVSAVEIHPRYCETIATNKEEKIKIPGRTASYYEGTKLFNADISTLEGQQLTRGHDVIDCLIGGPPCQAFSSAGKQLSIFDKRGSLIYEYLRILKEINPKTFLFENVRGLVTAKGKNAEPGEILIDLLNQFERAGYNCRVAVLNSAEYGAYQRRVRCFIVGSRIAAAPYFPSPSFSEEEVYSIFPEECREHWHTLRDFLAIHSDDDSSGWVRPSEKLAPLLQDVPAGKGLRSSGRVEATRPGGHWGYRQGTFIADLDKPARTVTGSPSQDWIRLDDGSLRRLTLREVSGLQGFPEEWVFCGTKADQFQQVGNAVPTVFGEVLGKMIADYLISEHEKYPSSNPVELPKDVIESIRYTKYDNEKNGAYRAKRFPG